MNIPFATGSYKHDSLPISAQRALNLYAEAQPPNAKTPVSMHGCPGITTFATCGVGPVRGAHLMGGVLYVVSGVRLYSVSNAATPVVTDLGGAILGSGVVSMDDNGSELAIVNGTSGFIYSTDGGFQLITDGDFRAANRVTTLDSFFLFNRAGTNEVFRSDFLEGTVYDSTAYEVAQSKSDNVVGVKAHKQLLYVFGERTIEPWNNTGAANFPFARIPNATIDRGIIGSHAFTEGDETLFIISDDRMAYKVAGTQLGRISTHAIEQSWQRYATVSDAFGMSYTFDGHKFATFTFPTQSATWVHDIATGLWHERESRDRTGNPLGRWRANVAITAYNKVLIGDCYSGKIGYLDPTVFTEFGDPMYAEAVSPPIHADGKRVFMSCFELDVETGKGLTTGQGSDPQVMLQISDDGGRTWGDMEPWQSMGQIGAYRQRLRWKRLGSFYQRNMKITISDPVKRTIVRAWADMTPSVGVRVGA